MLFTNGGIVSAVLVSIMREPLKYVQVLIHSTDSPVTKTLNVQALFVFPELSLAV